MIHGVLLLSQHLRYPVVSSLVRCLVKSIVAIRHTHSLAANTATVLDQLPMLDFQKDLPKSWWDLFVEQTVII